LGLPAHQYLYDFHHAPGFVLLAVIPDIKTLQSGDQTQPRLPVSLLDEIKEYLKKKNCPFARLGVMNPRYEGIDIQIKVKFYLGKGGAFYKEQLRADLRRQLAPWVSGALDQLRFGRQVSKSEVIRFVEALDYIDYICSITLGHECDPAQNGADTIVPLTARSILTAGQIEVDELERPCDRFDDQARPCVLPEPCIILDDYE
jgi:hypothetical protein